MGFRGGSEAGEEGRLTPRRRFLAALAGGMPDRLPATTHHLMPSWLRSLPSPLGSLEFFEKFNLDPILWLTPLRVGLGRGERILPGEEIGPHALTITVSDEWNVSVHPIPSRRGSARRFRIDTPAGQLSMVLFSDRFTVWVEERLIKHRKDIDIFRRFAPVPLCDAAEVNRRAREFGERGLIRGAVPGFDIYGQPGCWQDAAALFGIENLILAAFDDPDWVRDFLAVLRDRKLKHIRSMRGAAFDLVELGGGDASSTVISPDFFDRFVAPYDRALVGALHAAGQRVVYHTCGGMMPLLERIADLEVEAAETFTPPAMGGDVDLAEAKRRIGDRLCMIGGFDQGCLLPGCPPEKTRREVRRCFEAAGRGGGYILAPSDHFFQADPALVGIFADEARGCGY